MNDTYSLDRDKKSDHYNEEINGKLEEYYKKPLMIEDNHGNEDDFKGIDKNVYVDNDKIQFQVKSIVYAGYNTVTIPVIDYEKYKKIHNLHIIHAYYEEGGEKLKQYVIFKFQDLLHYDSKKKRRKRGKGENSKVNDTDNGTDFYYWDYYLIDEILLTKIIPTTVLDLEYSFIDEE
mgnify:CR=1 FL=1